MPTTPGPQPDQRRSIEVARAASLLRRGHDPARVSTVTRLPWALVQFLAEHPIPPDTTPPDTTEPGRVPPPRDQRGFPDRAEILRIAAITGIARIGGIGIAAVPGPPGGDATTDRPGHHPDPHRDTGGGDPGAGGGVSGPRRLTREMLGREVLERLHRLRRRRWMGPVVGVALAVDVAITAFCGAAGVAGLSEAAAFVALGLLIALGWCTTGD